jgi:hypothetical protein
MQTRTTHRASMAVIPHLEFALCNVRELADWRLHDSVLALDQLVQFIDGSIDFDRSDSGSKVLWT